MKRGMVIDEYSFGRLIFEGRVYKSDLLIYPDGRVEDSWWRDQGHVLIAADIASLLEVEPEVLVAGTGESGLMRPAADLEQFLDNKGIRFEAEPTGEAVEAFNDFAQSHRTAGCFHLTC